MDFSELEEFQTNTILEDDIPIKINNLNATFTTNINIFYLNDINDINFIIESNKNLSDGISKNSKKFLLKNETSQISGFVFKNGRIMIYLKDNDADNTFKIVAKELKIIYSNFIDKNIEITYDDVVFNYHLQFILPFRVDNEKVLKILDRQKRLSSLNYDTPITKIKLRDYSGIIFYIFASSHYISFNLYNTGTIQARSSGSKDIFDLMKFYCNHVYTSLCSMKYLIYSLNKPKKTHKKKKVIKLNYK